MLGRYEIPTSVRYHTLVVWVFFCLFAAVVVVGTPRGWFENIGRRSAWPAILMMTGFGVFLVAIQTYWWLTKAPRSVQAVEWGDSGIAVYPRSGKAVNLPRSDITQAQVPPDPGGATHGYYAAMSNRAALFVRGQALPYNLPLSFSPECTAFLGELEARTQVDHEKQRARR
jgi:hypothetical protein